MTLCRTEKSEAQQAYQRLTTSCLICSGIAKNDEVVAVEDFIDVGNILGKSWLSL